MRLMTRRGDLLIVTEEMRIGGFHLSHKRNPLIIYVQAMLVLSQERDSSLRLFDLICASLSL